MTWPLLLLALLLFRPQAGASPEDREGVKSAQKLYLKGMLLERRGEPAAALAAYEQAFKLDPRSAYIAGEAAELSLESGLLDKAETWARKAVSLAPAQAQVHIMLGRVLWAKGSVDSAQASFERALEIDPRSAESIFSLGALLSVKEPEKAKRLLERLIKQDYSQAAEAHLQIGRIDIQSGRINEGIAHLKRSIELEPGNESLAARYTLAQAYELQRATDSALSEYLAILKFEPQNIALLTHIGQIYVLKAQWEEVRRCFETVRELQPSDPNASHWLALYWERDGDYLKAAEHLKQSSGLKEEPALNLRLSYYLSQAGRLSQAVSVLEAAHKSWPDNDQVAYFLALGYDDLKREEDAIKLLREVVGLRPDFRDARFQFAVLLERTGRIEESQAQFRELLEHKPDDGPALNYLGYMLAERGQDLAQAEQLIAKAVRLEPKNGAYQDSLGWVHFKQGRSTQAAAELRQALEALPEDETIWDHLGDVYHSLGKASSAWRFWKRAEALSTEDSKGKSRKLEKEFSGKEVDALYRGHLRSIHGGLGKLNAICEIDGEVLGQEFKYKALFSFKGPDQLSIEVVGPLFTPLMKLRLTKDGLTMDSGQLSGVPSQSALRITGEALTALRDYLSGRILDLEPFQVRRGWRRVRVAAGGWRLSLGRFGSRMEGIEAPAGLRLELARFSRYQGRLIPHEITARRRGIRLTLRFSQINAELSAQALIDEDTVSR
ncbi:MAG: tetratricopeptide repeat protein [Elusimicrobia bacterium]|nr:tetratricopeptide repeat protein [Elusimicrobiota bacterium]